MIDVFDAKQGRDRDPGRIPIFDVEIVRVTALHIAHHVGNGSRRAGLENPMSMVVEETPAMDPHIVELGVLFHVNEGLLKVLGVAVDPLALVAALGNGVKLFRTEVTRKSHAVDQARWVPILGFKSLQGVNGGESGWRRFRMSLVLQYGTRARFIAVPSRKLEKVPGSALG